MQHTTRNFIRIWKRYMIEITFNRRINTRLKKDEWKSTHEVMVTPVFEINYNVFYNNVITNEYTLYAFIENLYGCIINFPENMKIKIYCNWWKISLREKIAVIKLSRVLRAEILQCGHRINPFCSMRYCDLFGESTNVIWKRRYTVS